MEAGKPGNRSKDGQIELGQNFAVHLMQHLVVPTFVLDAECNVLIWNKACERLTGITADEVLGSREHWRAFYESPRPCLADLLALGRMDEAKALYAAHDETSELSVGVHAENWCVMPALGTKLYLAIDAGPIYDEAGRLLAVIETLRDITDHHNAQTALEKLASRDGLTGVANRRSFDEKLANEWKRDRRDRKALSLLMIDVDHFKRYNDSYGHQAGDRCLQQIANILEEVVHRPGDLVARYGGEEFAIILSATDSTGASGVARRVLDRVAALAIPHSGGENGQVSLSIGVATIRPMNGLEPASLISSADDALYQAKHQGRNRYVLAPNPDAGT